MNSNSYIWDLESTGLLDKTSIDYSSVPYKLKDSFKVHCIVLGCLNTGNIIAFYDGPEYIFDGRKYEEYDSELDYLYKLEDYEPVEYERKLLSDFKPFIESKEDIKMVGHNTINYDHSVIKLFFGMDYEVQIPGEGHEGLIDTLCNSKCNIEDTMVMSKTLNADRFGGHSLDNLAKVFKCQSQKIQFRKNLKVEERFKTFAADMLYYNIFDVKSNRGVYERLHKDMYDSNWDYSDAYSLEKKVAEIITRQSHRGFKFASEKAKLAVNKLDSYIQDAKEKIEPLLPEKPFGKTELKKYTFNSKCFKAGNGEYTSHFLNFVKKHGGEFDANNERRVKIYDKWYNLPIAKGTVVKSHCRAEIKDTPHIKNWIVGELGWIPMEWGDRDLSTRQKPGVGKIKRNAEEYKEAVERYVDETIGNREKGIPRSPYCKFRLDHLGATESNFRQKLLTKKRNRAIKVLTSPKFTVGQEKEPCDNLMKCSDKFPYVKDLINYLTYQHRRNTILGGNFDPEFIDEDLEDGPNKGYFAHVREDGRIPTPADTCGCNTTRFKHKDVANVPRSTSLFGEELRDLFEVGEGAVQIGYDFDSLEAREEAHYCWPYDKDKEYCTSLLEGKPNSVHCRMAKAITKILGRDFTRNSAKSLKYGCLPTDNSEVLTKIGWKSCKEINIGDEVLSYNISKDCYEWDRINNKFVYQDAEVYRLSNKWFSVECTEDHNWVVKQRNQKTVDGVKSRLYTTEIRPTHDLNTESNILVASSIRNDREDLCNCSEDEAALVAWILADGYLRWSDNTSKPKYGVTCSVDQDDKYFVNEIRDLLNRLNADYTVYRSGSMNKFSLKPKYVREFFDKILGTRPNKHDFNWISWVLMLDKKALDSFVYNFWLADGTVSLDKPSKVITQKEGNILDALHLAVNLIGKRSSIRNHSIGSDIKILTMSDNNHITGQRLEKSYSRNTEVFCISTNNKSFVTKQNNYITLTGNCTYGATAIRVSRIIGDSVQVGQKVYNGFWEEALPLKKLQERLKEWWETKGNREFIPGIDGRKIYTRSPHSILNSLFQSAGVICAKRAMLIHDLKLKQNGMSVDFFRDSLDKFKTYCQQMIAYHDEAQLEADIESARWKVIKFDKNKLNNKVYRDQLKNKIEMLKIQTEESTGLIWSDIGHNENGYYIGYHKAGELAVEAVREAGEYYGLNVNLTAGYSLGRSWKECH